MTAYIIDKALLRSDDKEKSLLIQDNVIREIKDNLARFPYMRMDVAGFRMEATHVMLDLSMPIDATIEVMKDYFVKKFLRSGCSTLITAFSIQYEFQCKSEFKKMEQALLMSPIDYVIGIKIPVEKLTLNLIRFCNRNKLPIIFVCFKEESYLSQIPWGWIREAMFPYQPILSPVIDPKLSEEEKNTLIKKWQRMMQAEKIPHLSTELPEHQPLEASQLKKIGLYPKRGKLHVGGEVSYNLYRTNKKVEDQHVFFYDRKRLAIMVHKGQLIKVNQHICFKHGFGEKLLIKRPSLFV